METKTLTKPQFTKLANDIRALIASGKERAKQAAANELVSAYWEIGKRIASEHLTENAGYNRSVLEDLSKELSIDYSTLFRSVQFFQIYSIAPRGKDITWAQYKVLIPILNDEERSWYEGLAASEKLTRDQLASAIKRDLYHQQAQNAPTGKFGTQQPTIVRPTEPTYLYKAAVNRVIDGDTLLLHIDLGFQVIKEQRLRLAQIDAPEIDSPKGQAARDYILGQLAKAAFVMVKTNKIDIYGRYVGDVFYSFTEDDGAAVFLKGNYLNQELVSQGLANLF